MSAALLPRGVPLAKRLFDLLATALLLALISPLLLLLALLVRIYHGSPVIFRQLRGGYRGSTFDVYKFRSMSGARDTQGNLLPDDQRLTPFGRFLRASSLDELPELINVLRGEMSLVGPRPPLAYEVALYKDWHRRRLEAIPGITGLWQVAGRNRVSFDDLVRLDLEYIERQSLWLDLKILSLTLLKVFRRDGISQPGHATMPEFMGTPEETKTA